jgi:hypothetical protein
MAQTDISYNNLLYTITSTDPNECYVTPTSDFNSNVLIIPSEVYINDASYNVIDVSGFQNNTHLQHITLSPNSIIVDNSFTDASGLLNVYLYVENDVQSDSFPVLTENRPYFHLSGDGSALIGSLISYLNSDASNCFVYYSGTNWPNQELINSQFSETNQNLPSVDGSKLTVTFDNILSSGLSDINPTNVLQNNNDVNFIFTNPTNGKRFVKLQNQT